MAAPARPWDSLAEFVAFLDESVPALMDKHEIPGVNMSLVSDGHPAWCGAYGHADVDAGRQMTVDAVFRVESISKSVSAWGVMKLVEQGLVELDQPVERYIGTWNLPHSRYSPRDVTVRRLLSNTSGMAIGAFGDEYAPKAEKPSLRDTLNREIRFVREPGSGFIYSNAGYHVLELMIEQVTGTSFSEYMSSSVLTPLGMTNASYTWSEEFDDRIPTGYEPDGTPVPVYVYPALSSGGLFADVMDVARFVSAGMLRSGIPAGAVLSDGTREAMYAPRVKVRGLFGLVADRYGFGHFIARLAEGRTAVWHGGQGHGWMTHFHSIPELGEGIVILTNSQRSWPFMAEVLREWGRWTAAGSVKMSRIAYAASALRVLIAVLLVAAIWLLYSVIRGLLSGNLRFNPLSRRGRARRALQATAGLGSISLVLWRASLPYVFESSIFPEDVGTAAAALLAFGTALFLSSMFAKGMSCRTAD